MWPPVRLNSDLRAKHISRTKQREAVYIALGRFGPVLPADLVREIGSKPSRRTVYRTVKMFLVAQIAHELPGGLIELSPPYRSRHYFIRCRGCGRRSGFWDEALETKLDEILKHRRYMIGAHIVELSGVCNLCTLQI